MAISKDFASSGNLATSGTTVQVTISTTNTGRLLIARTQCYLSAAGSLAVASNTLGAWNKAIEVNVSGQLIASVWWMWAPTTLTNEVVTATITGTLSAVGLTVDALIGAQNLTGLTAGTSYGTNTNYSNSVLDASVSVTTQGVNSWLFAALLYDTPGYSSLDSNTTADWSVASEIAALSRTDEPLGTPGSYALGATGSSATNYWWIAAMEILAAAGQGDTNIASESETQKTGIKKTESDLNLASESEAVLTAIQYGTEKDQNLASESEAVAKQIQSLSQTDQNLSSDSETQKTAQAVSQTDTSLASESETQLTAQSVSETDTSIASEGEAVSVSGAQPTGSETDSALASESETQLTVQSVSETDTSLSSESETQATVQSVSETDTAIASDSETQATKQSVSQTDTSLASDSETQLTIQSVSETDTAIASESEAQGTYSAQTETDTNIASESESVSVSAGAQTGTETDTVLASDAYASALPGYAVSESDSALAMDQYQCAYSYIGGGAGPHGVDKKPLHPWWNRSTPGRSRGSLWREYGQVNRCDSKQDPREGLRRSRSVLSSGRRESCQERAVPC